MDLEPLFIPFLGMSKSLAGAAPLSQNEGVKRTIKPLRYKSGALKILGAVLPPSLAGHEQKNLCRGAGPANE